MPHLNELSKKYAKKGVVVTAVNVWEEREPKDDSYVDKVKKYVKDFGKGLTYNVVTDDPEGTLAKAWMEASGSGGIPATFVVDGKGTIQWMGHPMELDEPLEAMLAGTYDPAAEKAKKEAAMKQQAEMRAVMAPITKAAAAGDFKGAVAEIDKVYSGSPNLKMQLGMTKVNYLYRYDEAAAYAWTRTLSEEDFVKDDANLLNSLAWFIVDTEAKPKRNNPDLKLAIKLSERSNDLTKNEEPMFLDTLGLAYYRDGQLAKAIATQEKAVKLLKASKNPDANMLKELEDRLALMKKG